MPRKTFVAGEVLAAADVNEFLADQAVMTFAGTAARGSAIASPVEGMLTYMEDSNQFEAYGGTAVGWSSASNFIFGTAVPTDGQVASYSTAVSGWVPADAASGKILQVVSAEYSTQTATTSSTYVSTNLEVSITPSSTSSKIAVFAVTPGGHSGSADYAYYSLFRGGAAGTRIGSEVSILSLANSVYVPVSVNVLDSPSTTSPVTYTLCFKKLTSNTAYAQNENRTGSIIAMEVAG